MNYEVLKVSPMPGALGAVIHGLDLSRPLEEQAIAEIKHAFLDYQLLVFREQKITVDQQVAFSRVFGELLPHPFYGAIDGHEGVTRILKEPHHKVNNGGGWHADGTYMDPPPLGASLYLIDVPQRGGDTLFSNMYAAYDALSPKMKTLVEKLTAYHSSAIVYGSQGVYARSGDQTAATVATDQAIKRTEHPVVRIHPVTGRKSIFVNRANVEAIEGLSPEESSWMLEFLYQHCIRGEFVTRLRWEKNTVAIWDNRCTLHYALNDYHGFRREGLRVAIKSAH